jgi:hypothetical protein
MLWNHLQQNPLLIEGFLTDQEHALIAFNFFSFDFIEFFNDKIIQYSTTHAL